MTSKLLPCLARIGIACCLLLPATGWACRPAAGNRVPTNFELVQRADLIAIIQVDSGPEGSIPGGERADNLVRTGPMQVLKGVLPKDPLTLEGIVSRGDGQAFESAPTPLTASHFSTAAGSCTRQYFAKGSLILAMYEKRGDRLRPIDAPFARSLEDVESYDSLWVRAARRYVEIQQRAPGGGLREAVMAERDGLRAQGADMEAQAVAADLDAWLDRESGGERGLAGWHYDDGADLISVSTSGMAAAGMARLTCRRAGTALELTSPAKATRLGLAIGDRIFAADKGRIAFTPEIVRLLRQSAGPFAVTADGRPVYQGRASDLFQKFALRCETLLAP